MAINGAYVGGAPPKRCLQTRNNAPHAIRWRGVRTGKDDGGRGEWKSRQLNLSAGKFTMNPRLSLIKIVSLRLLIALFSVSAFTIIFLAASMWRGTDVAFTPCMPVLIGAIGGLVGLQRRVRRLSRDDLELLASSPLYMYLPPFVGGLLALLLFILFLSGLVEGKLFPHFVMIQPPTPKFADTFFRVFDLTAETAPDYAKLVFWSFVAGFSEKFVINVISQFQRDDDNKRHSD